MSEMVERVARAIFNNVRGVSPAPNAWKDYEGDARAALAAIREPTESMVIAAHLSAKGMNDFEEFRVGYRAMIDAALAEDA